MMPIRLTVVMTHPVQYAAPWFRHIAATCRELELTVLYGTDPEPLQRGEGFGVAIRWDTPLLDGYRHRVLRAPRASDSVHSDRFWGLDVPDIGERIRDTSPEVVLVPGWHSIALVRAIAACRRAAIPVVYRGDTHLGCAPARWRLPWMLRTRAALRGFDAYLSVGRRADAYLGRFAGAGARIFSAPHAVDNAFFAAGAAAHQTASARALARESLGLARADFAVLFAGKLEDKKRPLDLVRAMARVRGARLVVVGAGALEERCRDEAKRLGVETAWAGFLNQREIARAYAAADCLVLPSDARETWGLVVNEALATGLPCVVSDRVGCAPDLITPGETGDVFPAGDVAALARAIERVRASDRDLAAACRARVSAYSFERATDGLVTACRAVARSRGRRPVEGARSPAPAATALPPPPHGPRVLACCGDMVVVGGLERMTFEVLRAVRQRDWPVHCIVNSWDSDRIAAAARDIGASWSIGYYRTRFERRARRPAALARYAWDIATTSAGLLRDAYRFRPTHVLVPSYVTALRNAPALAILRLTGHRVILQIANAPDPGAFYRRLWRCAVSPVVSRFVANSAYTTRELLAHGIPPGKVSTIENCAPFRARARVDRIERSANRLIYIGQIIPPKGLDRLLDATALLVRTGRDVELHVVGDIDAWEPPAWRGYHARVLARAERRDLSGRVRFLGWREDVPDLLAGAALHCCPSLPEIREAFGLVNVEAKEAGTPSVVFPSGGVPELFDHRVDGWVCTSDTAEALAEGIRYFLDDPERQRQAGLAARRSARRFSRDAFAEQWAAVLAARDHDHVRCAVARE